MGHTVVYHAGPENVIARQCLLLYLLYSGTVFRHFGEGLAQAFHLQFQFYILLYQFVIDCFQMKITGHVIGYIIHGARYEIGGCKECASLVTVETE